MGTGEGVPPLRGLDEAGARTSTLRSPVTDGYLWDTMGLYGSQWFLKDFNWVRGELILGALGEQRRRGAGRKMAGQDGSAVKRVEQPGEWLVWIYLG